MSVRNRVPDTMRAPLGVVSLGVMILGAVLGYIFTILGITLLFDLNGIGGLTDGESAIVIATGVACLVLAYAGWRGFMGFAY